MIKKQHGFSAVEIILILVLLGVVGFGAWYVWQANNPKTTPTPTEQTEATAPAEQSDATTKTFERYGLTISYPADWKLDAQDNSQSTATTLTSPDFATTDDNTVGQSITFGDNEYLQSGLTAENFREKHLDTNPNPYSDYKELDINGKKAVQFYRGDSRQTVFFMPDGKHVTFTLNTFPVRNAPSTAYDSIIQSVIIQ